MLEKTTRMNILYDLYGMLLSEKQQQYMQLYYLDDLTLGEIAEEVNVSRQAVYDQIRRAEAQLELFEEKMKLLAKSERREQLYKELQALLTEMASLNESKVKSEHGLQLLKLLREID
jgi:hypothetical protein